MWRSSRAKEGSSSWAGWRGSGTRAVPVSRRACSAERSSRSRPSRPFRSTPTARSPGGFRSPCAAAKARYACSHELAEDVDPGPHVDADAGESAGHLALAESDQEFLGRHEGRDIQVSASYFDRTMRIAADPPGEIVRAREFECPNVA